MTNKLNVGCGDKYLEGWVNLDLHQEADVKHNLNFVPYPFKNNRFIAIKAYMIMEHLENPIAFLKELWRISEDGAIINISVPHANSYYTWCDITHKRGYTEESFTNFVDYLGGSSYYFDREKFEIVSLKVVPTPLGKLFPSWLRNHVSKYLNHINKIIFVELVVIKNRKVAIYQ